MADMTGGRAVVELLKAEGVRHIFGIVGATFLDVLDALYDDRSVEYVNVRHEQAAAFMADGLARVTGQPLAMLDEGNGRPDVNTEEKTAGAKPVEEKKGETPSSKEPPAAKVESYA